MSAASAPTHAPARGPSATPATTVIVVTGCTLGIAANRILPAAAAAASVPTRASSLLEPGPDSSQATPATINAPANKSSASAESFGWRATQAAEASAPSSANAAAALCNCELPHRRGRDNALGNEIATRILAQVAGAALALHTARPRVEQARGELGERRLARAVRTEQGDDLPTADSQLVAVDHRLVPVAEGHAIEPADRVTRGPGVRPLGLAGPPRLPPGPVAGA